MKLFFATLFVMSLTAASAYGATFKVKRHEYPELVFLSIAFKEQTRSCAGSFISSNYVVTSASCIMDVTERIADNVIIVTANEKLFNSSDIIVHENYDGISNNNIALIKIIFKDKEIFEHISVTLENLKELDTKDSFIGVPLIACGFGEVIDSRFIPELLICKDIVQIECPIYSPETICTSKFHKTTAISTNPIFLFNRSVKFNKMLGISMFSGSTDNKYLAFSQISSNIKWISKKAV